MTQESPSSISLASSIRNWVKLTESWLMVRISTGWTIGSSVLLKVFVDTVTRLFVTCLILFVILLILIVGALITPISLLIYCSLPTWNALTKLLKGKN